VFRVQEAEYRNIVDLAEIAKQKVQFMDEDLQDHVQDAYGAAEAARREFDLYTAEIDILGCGVGNVPAEELPLAKIPLTKIL